MNFATPLQGDRYEFEINGVTIKGLTGDSTLSDVISAINGSNAGVKVSYSSASDKFIMESSSTGEISNTETFLLLCLAWRQPDCNPLFFLKKLREVG